MAGVKVRAIYLLVCLLPAVAAYTCSYVDRYDRLHYLYCTSGACCGPFNSRYCCTYTSVGAIVGGVIGFIFFVSLITAITCCFCACCPGYRYRTRTVYVTTGGPNYASTGTTAPYTAQGRQPGPTSGPYNAQGRQPGPTSGPYTAKPTGAPAQPPPYQQV